MASHEFGTPRVSWKVMMSVPFCIVRREYVRFAAAAVIYGGDSVCTTASTRRNKKLFELPKESWNPRRNSLFRLAVTQRKTPSANRPPTPPFSSFVVSSHNDALFAAVVLTSSRAMTSALLRASRLVVAGRQRALGCGVHSSLSTQPFTWAPAAYRAPRKSGGLRHGYYKRRGGKKVARGLWQELQQVYGKTEESSKEQENDGDQESWKQRREYRRRELLSQSNQEFRALIHRYRNALFPNSSSQTKGSLMQLLQQLHSLCEEACVDNKSDSTDDEKKQEAVFVSMETIASTEDQFRDIGKLTGTLISLHSRLVNAENDSQQEKNSATAENLLRALIQLKQDRKLLVERAKEQVLKQQQESAKQKNTGLIAWFKDVFVSSSKEDTDGDEKKEKKIRPPLLAHEDASFGPTKRQYAQVIRSLKRETLSYKWQVPDTFRDTLQARTESTEARESQLSIANQMSALLQLRVEQSSTSSTSLALPVLQVYSQVGSLYAADEARRVYIGPCRKKVPQEWFHNVLRAYSLAALMEETHDARAKAARTATSLLIDREEAYSGRSYNLSAGSKNPIGESYAIVLETLLNAGEKSMPKRISQAEELLKRCIGEKAFDQVVGNRKGMPPSKVDISLFESLLLMYEYAIKRGEIKYLNMAKNIIESAEAQQAKVKTESTPVDGEGQSAFPNTKSYNSLLSAMNARVSVLYNRFRLTKEKGATKMSLRQDIQEHVDYATSILDRMTSKCPPDLRTFELLLDLLAMSDSPESGPRAQEIMSRMTIRQACTGMSNNTWYDSSKVYSSLLRCLAVGPEASSENLHRSLRILDKMEAESGIQHLPGSNMSDSEQEIYKSVYEQNEEESYKNAYNCALQICSTCQESETAFDTAFDIYNRMIAANVSPDRETFEYLFATCLLPGDDKEAMRRRQDLAGTVIAFASDHGVETKHMHKQLRSIKLPKSKRSPRRKAHKLKHI